MPRSYSAYWQNSNCGIQCSIAYSKLKLKGIVVNRKFRTPQKIANCNCMHTCTLQTVT